MLSISIVVPAYNEEKRLPGSLETILRFLRDSAYADWEVLVVDDGSTDGTADCVAAVAETEPRVRLLLNPGNRGKGYAVRHGMLEAAGEWVLQTDADLSAPIEQADLLQREACRQQAKVAIGSRALNRTLIGVRQSAGREYAGRFFNWMMQRVTGLPFEDTQCGFKLYHQSAARAVFARQQLEGFGFDVENLYVARLLGFKTIEVPVRWNNAEGTKVRFWQGINAFLDPLRVRLHAARGRYRG